MQGPSAKEVNRDTTSFERARAEWSRTDVSHRGKVSPLPFRSLHTDLSVDAPSPPCGCVPVACRLALCCLLARLPASLPAAHARSTSPRCPTALPQVGSGGDHRAENWLG